LKTINTLVTDIYQLLESEHAWISADFGKRFTRSVSDALQGDAAVGQPIQARKGSLRLSKMGDQCPRALWYSVHHPELAAPLPAWAIFKYTYGHVIEALALELARASGHRVEGEQDELVLDGITGHRDAVVDGFTVDVKSCTSFTLAKLKGDFTSSDGFGYLDQLDGYVVASANDPLVINKEVGCILGVDKTLGHMILYEHRIREDRIRKRIKYYKSIADLAEAPSCNCETRSIGASGNTELGTKASYSAYKFECFPGLRTFLYANGPTYLSKVVRKPDVPEIDRFGKLVYNA
jgi:hypothetical protein